MRGCLSRLTMIKLLIWLLKLHLIYQIETVEDRSMFYDFFYQEPSYSICKNCNFDKGLRNGYQCIVEFTGTQDYALVGDPAGDIGESAFDRDNAQAPFLIPFVTWTTEYFKWQNKPCTYLIPNRYIVLAAAIVYFTNDVTIPFKSMTSQMHTKITLRTFMRPRLNGLKSFWNQWIGAWLYSNNFSHTRA